MIAEPKIQKEIGRALELLLSVAPAVQVLPPEKIQQIIREALTAPEELEGLKTFLDLTIKALDEIADEDAEHTTVH